MVDFKVYFKTFCSFLTLVQTSRSLRVMPYLFPEVEQMTDEERARNRAACDELVPGKFYVFDPPVNATAMPVGGQNAWKARSLEFSRGWYIGFVEADGHIFQGKPDEIPDDIDPKLAESYFAVLFKGGSVATVDANQESEA